MEYVFPVKYVKELAIANRKNTLNQLWEVCMVETSYSKDDALNLYDLVRFELQTL